MKNIFKAEVTEELIDRINRLNPDTQPNWGKMKVDQMLAHCAVAYEMAFTDKHPKPNALMRFLLKTFVKKGVTKSLLSFFCSKFATRMSLNKERNER